MAQIELSSFERSSLRSQAHILKPVVMIGDAGLSTNVLREINHALNAHELIKIRILGDDREQRRFMMQEICNQLEAAPIQQIGKLLVIWRPAPISQAVSSSKTRKPHIPKKKAAYR